MKLLEELLGKIAEIYDVGFAEEITEIYKGLVLHTMELRNKLKDESERYRDLEEGLEENEGLVLRAMELCNKLRDESKR